MFRFPITGVKSGIRGVSKSVSAGHVGGVGEQWERMLSSSLSRLRPSVFVLSTPP
jgi:hypothetical protein